MIILRNILPKIIVYTFILEIKQSLKGKRTSHPVFQKSSLKNVYRHDKGIRLFLMMADLTEQFSSLFYYFDYFIIIIIIVIIINIIIIII